jgi:DNA-binding IclR family transcriptional regulator
MERGGGTGLRLQEVIERTGLAKATVHRLLNESLALRDVELDATSSRCYLGFELFAKPWSKR